MTPPRSRWSPSAAGGSSSARAPARTRGGCWSPATPAEPATGATGPGKPGWRNSRSRRGWRSRCATSRPAPPGTSKWNKIEHRLFSRITLAWRGRPPTSHDVIVNTIGAVTTSTGLAVTAVLDPGRYPAGTRISGEQINQIEDRALTRHRFHGEWNYTFGPAPRPAPRPPPPPAPPGPDLDALAHPALTGMSRAAFDDLTAGLELPCAAAREQRLHLDRGRARRGRPEGPAAPLKLSLPACLLAAIYRYRPSMTCQAIADLFAVGHSTISVVTRHINGLLTDQDTAITPGPRRIRSLQDLRGHAARYGITITAPAPAGTPPDDTLTIPTCP
jgi:hypothetical protein